MKVAIFTMFTSNYCQFYDKWLEKITSNFLPETEKEIFLFSDKAPNPSVNHWFEIQHEKWPMVTLKRYINFSKSLNCLGDYTNIVYMDIDVLVQHRISELPDTFYFGLNHPDGNKTWELETKLSESKAYVDTLKLPLSYHYKQGCFWGGKCDRMKNMISKLSEFTNIDLSKGIIPKWHDESYLNKFFIDVEPNELYSFPVGFIDGQTPDGNFNKDAPLVHIYKDYVNFNRHEYV